MENYDFASECEKVQTPENTTDNVIYIVSLLNTAMFTHHWFIEEKKKKDVDAAGMESENPLPCDQFVTRDSIREVNRPTSSSSAL